MRWEWRTVFERGRHFSGAEQLRGLGAGGRGRLEAGAGREAGGRWAGGRAWQVGGAGLSVSVSPALFSLLSFQPLPDLLSETCR